MWSLVFSVAHVSSSVIASLLPPHYVFKGPHEGDPCLTTKKCLLPLSCLLTNFL